MSEVKDTVMEIDPVPVKAPSTYKDFSLSSSQLFFDLPEPIDLGPVKVQAPGDDFEKIEAHSPFVSAAIQESQRSRTENSAPTFSTSDDPRLDFFFHVMEQTSPDIVLQLLEKSWKKESLDALKLVASLRDIKDGKGIRQQYQYCMYWLYQNHPLTLYNNLPQLLKLGYWKDALQFLIVVLFDGFVHPYFAFDDGNKNISVQPVKRRGKKRSARARIAHQTDSEKRIYNVKIAQYFKMENALNIEKIKGKDMEAAMLKYAREVFAKSQKYRTFHIRIAQIFATQLAEDLALFNGSDKKKDISLAAKWAPSLEGHFDRYLLIASTISVELARILQKDFVTKSLPIQTATYLARKFYTKQVCVPLRAHLSIPERDMSAGNWSKVDYKRVPSKCMQINKAHFIKHDKERLMAYLTKDTTKVAGATLKPIDLMRRAMAITPRTDEAEKLILEKQWVSLVEDIKKKGSLMSGAIAICDVSGSMHGDPMLAALGLTLLTMAQTKAPWNEICVTFHENPTMFHLQPDLTLEGKVAALRAMEWGGSTNFQATLDLILGLGIKNHLPQDEMPKILFVFTDMEFNEAFPGTTMTNFETARQHFELQGYQLPAIVFWNLRADTRSTSTPVQKNENGVILLSGFSGQLLSFVMNQTDLANCTPWNFVKKLFEVEKYATLKIFD